MKKSIFILIALALFAAKVQIDPEQITKTDALILKLTDDGKVIREIDIREKEGTYTADIPEEFRGRDDLRASIFSNTDPLVEDAALYRLMSPMDAMELGLTIGDSTEHVEFSGQYLDMRGRKIEDVATPTSADSVVGPAVSTPFLYGEIKSESSSYKFYSR